MATAAVLRARLPRTTAHLTRYTGAPGHGLDEAGRIAWFSVQCVAYTVHALRNLTIKNTGFEGIYKDVLILCAFSAIMIGASIALFKRQL